MFAVLHIADFALHAVLRTEAGLSGRPAALFSGSGKKSLVLALNPLARAAGVEPGMTAPQAVARCPSLIIRAPRAEAEAEARAALLAIGFTLSPSIEDTAPGVCTCDFKGHPGSRTRGCLAGSAEPESNEFGHLAGAAVAQLEQLGLPATAGVARTPLLALYAARAAARSRSSFSLSFSPVLSDAPMLMVQEERTRNDYENEERSPVQVVTDETNFLAPLPLVAADPSPELAQVLANWGLRTLGDLTALPRDDIVRRFGSEGLALWNRATGGAMRPLHPVTPARTFCAEMEFEDAIETLEPLLFILRRFLDRLALELRTSQHVAAEIELTLKLEDESAHARGFRLPEPTADVEIMFRALHTHLESLSTAASIVAVALRLTPARPLVRQQGLFETGLRDPHGFAETLARVSALVGADRVGTPQLEDTHRPDAFKLTPPAAVVPPPAAPPTHPPSGLPLRRFRPPLPARLGSTDDGATYVWADGLRGEISFRSHAYPSSGDWWQSDRAWQRVEWDIALSEGGLYRLLQVGGDYFIEGEYD